MAVRFARRIRPAIAVAALGISAAIAVPTIAAAAAPAGHSVRPSARPSAHPGTHKPATIASVQKKLAHLAVRNSQLVEQFNQARVLVHKRSHAAAHARQEAGKAAAAYNTANAAFTQVVQAQYESGGFGGSSGALLTSTNSNSYLDAISTMSLVSSHEAQVVSNVKAAHKLAAASATRAASLLTRARADQRKLVAKKSQAKKQIHYYRAQLAKLNAAQLATYNNTVDPQVSASNFHPTATSAAAQRAVNFAIKQIGKPYVFGAAGPSSYDCSGLTMMAWQAGGVSLPHSALEQYNYGTHVSRSQLQPGDLIFFYQPIGHVTIYVGDGMMVSAPETGENVSLVPLSYFNSDYAGATHIG